MTGPEGPAVNLQQHLDRVCTCGHTWRRHEIGYPSECKDCACQGWRRDFAAEKPTEPMKTVPVAGYGLALRLDLIAKQLGEVLEQVALAAAELRQARGETDPDDPKESRR